MRKKTKILNIRVAALFVVTISLLMLMPMVLTAHAQTVLIPIEDSTVSSCMPDTNEGNLEILYAQSGSCERWAYLKFDLSGLPDETIDNAVLWLFCRYDGTEPLATIDVDVCEANNSWTENEITWNNKPLSDPGPVLATSAVDGTGEWYRWESNDLTTYIDTHRGSSVSLIVKLPDMGIVANQRAFFSKENLPSHPLLDINPPDPGKRSIGGFDIPMDNFAQLAPYVAVISLVSVGAFATLVSIKRKKEK
jgi:hypothetical protein